MPSITDSVRYDSPISLRHAMRLLGISSLGNDIPDSDIRRTRVVLLPGGQHHGVAFQARHSDFDSVPASDQSEVSLFDDYTIVGWPANWPTESPAELMRGLRHEMWHLNNRGGSWEPWASAFESQSRRIPYKINPSNTGAREEPNIPEYANNGHIVTSLDENMGRTIAGATRRTLDRVSEQDNDQDAKAEARRVLDRLPDTIVAENENNLNRLFAAEFMSGVSEVGTAFAPNQTDVNVLDWLKNNPNGFIPALKDLTNDATRRVERVIEQSYTGDSNYPFDLPSLAKKIEEIENIGKKRARLIVRTETAKASALGRMMAWGRDPERNWYDYMWIAWHDDRTKDISLKWDEGSPYTYEQMLNLWLYEHNRPQLVTNRHTGKTEYQTSAFNCRCSVARVPKEPEQLLQDGLITEEEYELM